MFLLWVVLVLNYFNYSLGTNFLNILNFISGKGLYSAFFAKFRGVFLLGDTFLDFLPSFDKFVFFFKGIQLYYISAFNTFTSLFFTNLISSKYRHFVNRV